MSNIFTITVEDAAAQLVTYDAGALIRVQSSATEGGSYVNLTGSGSTPTIALISGLSEYVVYDPAGDSTTWYKYRFEASDGDPAGSYSDAFLAPTGSGLLCTLADVKLRLGRNLSTDTVDDELIVSMIGEVSDWIQTSVIHRKLTPIDATTMTLDGLDAWDDGSIMPVPAGIRTLTNVEIATATGESFGTAAAGTYFLRPTEFNRPPGWPATQVHLSDQSSDRFYDGYANVRLTGTFGWTEVPREVREIAATAVVRAYHARAAGQQDIIGNDDYGRPIVSRYVSRRDKDTLRRYDATPLGVE
jgi:hypothetical protein